VQWTLVLLFFGIINKRKLWKTVVTIISSKRTAKPVEPRKTSSQDHCVAMHTKCSSPANVCRGHLFPYPVTMYYSGICCVPCLQMTFLGIRRGFFFPSRNIRSRSIFAIRAKIGENSAKFRHTELSTQLRKVKWKLIVCTFAKIIALFAMYFFPRKYQ